MLPCLGLKRPSFRERISVGRFGFQDVHHFFVTVGMAEIWTYMEPFAGYSSILNLILIQPTLEVLKSSNMSCRCHSCTMFQGWASQNLSGWCNNDLTWHDNPLSRMCLKNKCEEQTKRYFKDASPQKIFLICQPQSTSVHKKIRCGKPNHKPKYHPQMIGLSLGLPH